MTIKRVGFTLIEVSLFLAVTALLFVGVTIGTQNSINQQRYSEAVNGFADFIKNVYSQVSNPQSNGKGNSDKAIYGKLISIGESEVMGSGDKEPGERANTDNQIFTYDIIGDIDANYSGASLQESLKELGATVVGVSGEIKPTGMSAVSFGAIGVEENYIPKWQSTIESTAAGTRAKAEIAIIRHPRSGTINTIVWKNTVMDINQKIRELGGTQVVYINGVCKDNCEMENAAAKFIGNNWDNFSSEDIDICVAPFGDSTKRTNIRITKDARNSSGVVVVDLDGDDNRCK